MRLHEWPPVAITEARDPFLVILTERSAASDRVNTLSSLKPFLHLTSKILLSSRFSSLIVRLLPSLLCCFILASPTHAVPQGLVPDLSVYTNSLGVLIRFHGFKGNLHAADSQKYISILELQTFTFSCLLNISARMSNGHFMPPKWAPISHLTLPLVKTHCSKWALHPSRCSGQGLSDSHFTEG